MTRPPSLLYRSYIADFRVCVDCNTTVALMFTGTAHELQGGV